jgi:hypothetical protein
MNHSLAVALRFAARIVGTVLVIVVIVGLFQWAWFDSSNRFRQRIDRKNRTELTRLFTDMANDGILPNPPYPATNFTLTSRHGMEPYFVSYTDAQRHTRGYSATRILAQKIESWQFEEIVSDRHIQPPQLIYRGRLTNR